MLPPCAEWVVLAMAPDRKSRLQSSEIRTDIGEVVITPVLPERTQIRVHQPGYTLEVPFYDAEQIAESILEHVEECRDFLQGQA